MGNQLHRSVKLQGADSQASHMGSFRKRVSKGPASPASLRPAALTKGAQPRRLGRGAAFSVS